MMFSWRRLLAFAYLMLLAASHVARLLSPPPAPPLDAGEKVALLSEIDAEATTGRSVQMVYRDLQPAASVEAPTVVLIHGSPGSQSDFRSVAPRLVDQYRVLVPDLPGFGKSSWKVADYSIQAHAGYVLQLLDRLEIESVHVAGFSMGGGVAISLQALAPQRVRSLSLLSSIGVQEFELLGDYHLNHIVHGVQLAGLWLMREGFPHFGELDRAFLGVPYARNFYDTDQRPLRTDLEQYQGPMLIFHGKTDPLVPVAAALEHQRIVPQSELILTSESHFAVFMNGPSVGSMLRTFLDKVENGQGTERSEALPERLARSRLPFDPRDIPQAAGLTFLVFFAFLGSLALISGDFGCIAAGLLAAAGRIDFWWAALACIVGVSLADLALYWSGRLLGRRALDRPLLRSLIRQQDIEQSSRRLRSKGPAMLAVSRVVTRSRLHDCLAAGIIKTRFWVFALCSLPSAAFWALALAVLSMWVGGSPGDIGVLQNCPLLGLAALSAMILFTGRLILSSGLRSPGKEKRLF